VSDDLERQLGEMMHNRVADLPDSYDVAPRTLKRARRRRATKFAALVTAMALVVVGTGAAVARGTRNAPDRVSTDGSTTTTVESHTVPTVACPVTYAITPDQPLPPPAVGPRAVTVPGADRFVSYAVTTDERSIVLGPAGWTCSAQFAADGQDGMSISRAGSGGGVSILNDFLWHGGVGSPVACAVTDDPAVQTYVQEQYPELVSACHPTGRVLTRVDDHVTTFVDASGARGASWIVLPSGVGVDDGKVSVLTCQPTTGLSAADCDVIIADWISRLDTAQPPSAATTIAPAPFPALDWAATESGMVILGPQGNGLASYDTATDRWRTYERPPFSGIPNIVAVRGDTVFAMAIPASANQATPFAALDLATGTWRFRSSVPRGVPLLRGTGDAEHIFGVGSFEDVGDTPAPRTVAAEYDVSTDRWTTLPDSPLSARAGAELAWTGKELLVWSGGSNHQGFVPSYTDGAAYDPATRSWRALPKAPITGRAWAATAWTGTEMLVWGGDDCGCGNPPTGGNAAYNPATNRWRPLAASPLAPSRTSAGVWTGHEFVVLGSGAPHEVAVAAYDPSTDTWRSLPAPPEGARAAGDAAFAAYANGRAVFAVGSDGALAAFAYPAGT
jgi:hypothetical protein